MSEKAEICAVLLPLRCAIAWYDFFADKKRIKLHVAASVEQRLDD